MVEAILGAIPGEVAIFVAAATATCVCSVAAFIASSTTEMGSVLPLSKGVIDEMQTSGKSVAAHIFLSDGSVCNDCGTAFIKLGNIGNSDFGFWFEAGRWNGTNSGAATGCEIGEAYGDGDGDGDGKVVGFVPLIGTHMAFAELKVMREKMEKMSRV